MNIFLTIAALVMIGVGIFVNRSGLVNAPDNLVSETQPEVLSVKEERPEENNVDDNVEEIVETPTPTTTAPTNPLTTSNSEIDSYKYPNAQITKSSDNSLSLSTTDDADTVTSWYKDKFQAKA